MREWKANPVKTLDDSASKQPSNIANTSGLSPTLRRNARARQTRSSGQPARLLVKPALRACERGDLLSAIEALRGVLALPRSEEAAPPPPSRRAVTIAKFAQLTGYSARHVRSLLARGTLPQDAIIGSGRSKRILIERGLEAMRTREPTLAPAHAPDSVRAAGAEYVKRRGRLRIVKGGSNDDRA
jgi:hypothetical protein